MSYLKKLKKFNWLLFGKICYWVLLVFVCLIALLIIVSILPLPKNYNLYSVHSGSMEPTIRIGDLILTKEAETYQKGDVVTFLPSDVKDKTNSVTHRIVEINKQRGVKTFTTKGDANQSADSDEITKDRILGKYQLRVPLLGYPVGFAKTTPGLILLIIVPAVAIIYDEALKIKKEISKRGNEKD